VPITSIPSLLLDTILPTGAMKHRPIPLAGFGPEWNANALQWESVAFPQHHVTIHPNLDVPLCLCNITDSAFSLCPLYQEQIQLTGNVGVCAWVSVACPSHQSTLLLFTLFDGLRPLSAL